MFIGNPIQTGGGAGYIDAHVHLTHAGVLQDLANAGIAAVRDAGTKQGTGLALRRAAAQDGWPVIISAGRALSCRGGYGAFLGTAVETRGEIAAEISRLRNDGADIIKVIASGIVDLERSGTVTAGGFSADDLRFIVEEAGSHGLRVMAHANGEAAIRTAAEAGVRSIEHGFFMTEAALEALAEHKTFWVPTVGALQRAAEAANAPAGAREIAARIIAEHLKMIGKAYLLGVQLGIGTDCTLPDPKYKEAFETELAYFREAGIPADDVCRIAVEGGRKLLGLNQKNDGKKERG